MRCNARRGDPSGCRVSYAESLATSYYESAKLAIFFLFYKSTTFPVSLFYLFKYLFTYVSFTLLPPHSSLLTLPFPPHSFYFSLAIYAPLDYLCMYKPKSL